MRNNVTLTYYATIHCLVHGAQETPVHHKPAPGAKERCPKCHGLAPVTGVRVAMAEATQKAN